MQLVDYLDFGVLHDSDEELNLAGAEITDRHCVCCLMSCCTRLVKIGSEL